MWLYVRTFVLVSIIMQPNDQICFSRWLILGPLHTYMFDDVHTKIIGALISLMFTCMY